jgi:hypothetical protein
MLFNFQLRALADITPWGWHDTNPQSDLQSLFQAVGPRPKSEIASRFVNFYERPSIHWFGLTDGWYWLQMNENDEFFRYSTDLLTHWQERYPAEPTSAPWQKSYPTAFPPLPYADYYVVRLWEDILELLPLILEPLPPKFAHMLETEEQVSRWQKRVKQWEKAIGIEDKGEEEEQTEDYEDGDDMDEDDMEVWETYLQATMWWYGRELSAFPLTAPPRLWFWNDGRYIHGFWDNSQLCIKNIPAWETQRGQIQLLYVRFLDEVASFHTRLFRAMEERIQEAKRSWPRPDVYLDLDKLEKAQQVRSPWLAQALERAASRATTDWNAVVDAMRTMDRLSGFLVEEK